MGNSSSEMVTPPDYICEYGIRNCPNHPPTWKSTVYTPPVSSDTFTIGREGGRFSRREERGYELLVPQGSVPSELEVKVDVHYPYFTHSESEETELMSGVVHIESKETELEDGNPASLLMEHCINIESAEDRDSVDVVTQEEEEFISVDDSDVDVRIGCVQVMLKKLGSLYYAVIRRGKRKGAVAYCGMMYRLKLEASLGSSMKFFFMVVKDLSICIKAVKEKCDAKELEKAYYEPVRVIFAPVPDDQEMTLILDMEKKGVHNNGWHIYPCTWPAEILECDACNYNPKSPRVPSLELQATWKYGPEMEGFVEFIDIKGTKTPKSLSLQFDVVRPFFQETSGAYDTTDPTVPKMKELIKFAGVERNLNIPEEIGTNYLRFGIFLLEDETGTTIRNIEWQYRYNSEAINIEILRRWLEGKGRKPVQWNTLIEVLTEISKGMLAKDIANGLKAQFRDI